MIDEFRWMLEWRWATGSGRTLMETWQVSTLSTVNGKLRLPSVILWAQWESSVCLPELWRSLTVCTYYKAGMPHTHICIRFLRIKQKLQLTLFFVWSGVVAGLRYPSRVPYGVDYSLSSFQQSDFVPCNIYLLGSLKDALGGWRAETQRAWRAHDASAKSSTQPAYSISHKGGKNVLIIKQTCGKVIWPLHTK